MFVKYNFVNIISLLIAGVISSVYFYILGIPFTEYIIAASITYFVFFVLILVLTSNIERNKFTFLENKVFLTGELIILFLLISFSLINRGVDYWNAAGVFVLGLIIVFDSNSTRENVTRFILLIISPVFYTGLILKHGYFTEVIFFCAFLLLADKFLKAGKNRINYFITSVSLGFIMLFNPYLMILYVIFFLYYFRDDLLKRGVPFLLISAVTYLIIKGYLKIDFTPVGINPETGYFVIVLIISIYVGLLVRTVKEVIFCGSIAIVLLELIKSLSNEYSAGILVLSCIYPMLIIASGDYKTEKWLGKILVD